MGIPWKPLPSGNRLPQQNRESPCRSDEGQRGLSRKQLLSGLALSLAIAAPAAAADLRMPVKAPAPVAVASVYNWTGFYVGAHCGWAQSRTTTDGQNGAF